MFHGADGDAGALEPGAGQDEEASEAWLIEVSDRVDQVPIERDAQATSLDPEGVNRRVTFRRSVSVQPSGGVIRSACSVHSE